MKLLRCGKIGSEKPAVLDKNGKIRNLSSYVKDFNSKNLNFETLAKLQKKTKRKNEIIEMWKER